MTPPSHPVRQVWFAVLALPLIYIYKEDPPPEKAVRKQGGLLAAGRAAFAAFRLTLQVPPKCYSERFLLLGFGIFQVIF